MKIYETKDLRLKCDCSAHEISAEVEWEEFNERVHSYFSLAFWKIGHFNRPWPIKHKLFMIWTILKHGHCHSDMVFLNKAERKKLYEFLKEVVETDDKYNVLD